MTDVYKSRIKKVLAAYGLAALVVFLDQISKIKVRDYFLYEGAHIPVIPDILQFMFVKNEGAAFGMFAGNQIIFIVIALIVVLIVTLFLVFDESVTTLQAFSLGAIVGGAIGNLIDRVIFDYVTDFISVLFIDFPVFNIADIAITLGCVVFIISLFKMMHHKEKSPLETDENL